MLVYSQYLPNDMVEKNVVFILWCSKDKLNHHNILWAVFKNEYKITFWVIMFF